jgi:hypothetical protein
MDWSSRHAAQIRLPPLMRISLSSVGCHESVWMAELFRELDTV